MLDSLTETTFLVEQQLNFIPKPNNHQC